MKNKLLLMALVALTMLGCQEPIQTVVGSYSYKTSGTVETHSQQVVLPNESGSLEVLQESKNLLRLVFNQMGGSVYMTTATYEDDVLTLDTLYRTITVELEPYELTVVGKGSYHDGVIVFDLQYAGVALQNDSTLVGENILMVAKR